MAISGIASADCPIPSYIYDVNTNNSSPGTTLKINSTCTGGTFTHPEGTTSSVIRMKITSPDSFGSRGIVFLRSGTVMQLYKGRISSDNKIIAGSLTNTNNTIKSLEDFPFYAVLK